MKKVVAMCILFCICMACIFGGVAEGIMPYADPNANVDNPVSLPYGASSFSFGSYTYTKAMKVPDDGTVTITLTKTKLSSDHTLNCAIEVCYWGGQYWHAVKVKPSSFKVSNTESSYTFTASGLPKGGAFYVGLSKSDYPSVKCSGSISVKD